MYLSCVQHHKMIRYSNSNRVTIDKHTSTSTTFLRTYSFTYNYIRYEVKLLLSIKKSVSNI